MNEIVHMCLYLYQKRSKDNKNVYAILSIRQYLSCCHGDGEMCIVTELRHIYVSV